MTSSQPKIFEFMKLIGNLKRVKRTGWVLRNVKDPESVADHMYRMAMLAFLVDPKTGIEKEKCIKMALVHDMAETIVGDITPNDGISLEDKRQREEAAMIKITSLVDKDVGEELYSLWLEYEDQKTKESKFVKDLDKYEMILQAQEYEQVEGRPSDLQEFFDSTEGVFQTSQVQKWAKDLKNIRRIANGDIENDT